jgi:outer membrane protein OmpA-like peptidoglycan-associated protein
MKKTHLFNSSVVGILMMLSVGECMAQDGHIRRGNKHFEKLAYVEAINAYERAALKGAEPREFAGHLAESYWKLRDSDKAMMWYAKAVAVPDCSPELLYRYSEALRSSGEFDQADSWLGKYQARMGGDVRASLQSGAGSYGPELQSASLDKVVLTSLSVNSEYAEISPMMQGGQLYFASARDVEVNTRRRHTWNNEPFLELYSGKIGPNGELTEFTELDGINTSYHESNVAFSEDGKTIYFTRNNFHDGKKQLTGDRINNLKIYSRTWADGMWVDEQSFPYNSNDYSIGHPSLTADGLTMFFTSDMKGGYGGTDIWMTEFTNGSWSKPTNLGPNVNTPGNEMFPFIHSSGVFFFSSDGQKGLGGMDVVYTNLEKGNSQRIKNPGAPINSGADDFGLVLNEEMTRGYFVTNRPGGKGSDDIMLFDLTAPFGGVIALEGAIIDASNGNPLADVRVDLMDTSGGADILMSTMTDASGKYRFQLEADKQYALHGSLEEYRNEHVALQTEGLKDQDTTLLVDLNMYPENALSLVVSVKNSKTAELLEGVDVEVSDLSSGNQVLRGRTDEQGSIRSVLEGVVPGDELEYAVSIAKKGFAPEDRIYRRKVESIGEVMVIEDMVPIEVGGDLAKLIDIEPIYFDVSKSDIRPDAAVELDKIVGIMNEYPDMIIELGSHTDSRGSDSFNATLSDKRAKSSAAYIVSKGIAQNRITGKGYGESKLVNRCKNGVKCSKEEHQENRRTEFIIIGM